jgi:hypothetical protein
MKTQVLVLVSLLMSTPVLAQTITVGPVPAGAVLSFKVHESITTAQEALTFEARLNRNGQPLTAMTASLGLTCSAPIAPATKVACQWVLSEPNREALNKVGLHNLTVSMFRADVGDSPVSVPFSLKSPAGAPSEVGIFVP